MNIQYETIIRDSFATMGFEPRPGQIEGVNLILTEFINNKKTDVVLVAPTGSGKSIVGVVVAEALSRLVESGPLKSVFGMHQNVLVDQYGATFAEHKLVMQIKGTANYRCGVMDDSAENCVSANLHSMNDADALRKKHCDSCEYNALRKRRNAVDHLITNYSFVFVDRMYAGLLEPRLIYVWDEAHMLNDVFTEHNAIYVSVQRLKYFLTDLSGHKIQGVEDTVRRLLEQLESGKVNDSNYIEFITPLRDAYLASKEFFEKGMFSALFSKDFQRFKKFGALYKKYGNLSCKISDLLKYDYEHVFDYNADREEFSIKSIFIGKMFDVIRNSKYNLFMSATLSEDFISYTMDLDVKSTAFVRMPSHFPKENKKVVFVEPMMNLNVETMKKPETIKGIQSAVVRIVRSHTDLGDSGIVMVPSFILGEKVADALRKSKVKTTIFEHVRGEKVAVVLEKFKKFKGPCVLVSPSVFEGVDLAGDVSRFQIVTKVPWPSLGDKRMKLIADTHKKMYKAITLHKLIQSLGRSVRSQDDYAATYILDKHGFNLLRDSMNVWDDEFESYFVNIGDV